MKILVLVILLFSKASFSKVSYSKAPFLTIRKFSDIDSTPVTTITCRAKIKVLEKLKNSWFRVKSGGREGFVLSRLLTQKNDDCMSKRKRFLLNSISLSADEIYLWAKLGEHFIEGEVNDF